MSVDDSLNKKPGVALEVKNVSKSFRLPTEQASGIKQAFLNYVRGIKGYKEQKVLENISFEVKQGDFFGIVGRNGSGKSTLLKLISQIYVPDKGDIRVKGKLVPFIELGVGFNPELTGRENVYLNGALLGFSHDEVSKMYEDIVEFAELEEFMDQKLKNYSSGMQVRLAFSIAIKAQGDILVLDEVLAVGDEAFQRKCFEYFAQLKRQKKTVILVTHSMDNVRQFCNRAALIDKGYRLEVGDPGRIAKIYRDLNNPQEEPDEVIKKSSYIGVKGSYTSTGDRIRLSILCNFKKSIKDAVATLIIMKSTGEWVYRWASDEKLDSLLNYQEGDVYEFVFEIDNIFCDGIFNVEFALMPDSNRKDRYVQADDIIKFEIMSDGYIADKFWKPSEKISILKVNNK